MKRDWNMVRTILLRVEADVANQGDFLNGFEPDSRGEFPVVWHHIRLLEEAGYISDLIILDDASYAVSEIELTWNGHEFLDSIRNEKVWTKLSEKIRKFGSMTAPVLQNLAADTVMSLVKGEI